MKFINYIIICIFIFINSSIAEENPDLNPSSSGGAVFVKTPRSDVDKFLNSKNMKRGRNTKSDGTHFLCLLVMEKFLQIEIIR